MLDIYKLACQFFRKANKMRQKRLALVLTAFIEFLGGISIIAGLIIGFSVIVSTWFDQIKYFGRDSGRLLMYVELGVLAAAILVTKLFRSNKRTLGFAIGFLALALCFCFFGWFVHPDQIYARASERVSDFEEVISQYKNEYHKGDQNAASKLQRASRELLARKVEFQAAKIRYDGEKIFSSEFFSWTFWSMSVVLIGLGIFYIHQHINLSDGVKDQNNKHT